MSRIAYLMLFFVFLASVGFWTMDQYKIKKNLNTDESEAVEEVKEFMPEDVSEEVQDYLYGFFEGDSEIRVYEELELEEVKELLDNGYELLVLVDGGVLDQSRYNFGELKMVKVGDYDGEFIYSSKYGMEVSGGVMISIRDFEKSFEGSVVAFDLN